MGRMDQLETEEPAPAAKLALGSAVGADALAYRCLFILETRLERAVHEASEPIIAQLKLAWWRDRFADDPANWPKGEPLLEALASWGGHAASLGRLVDGWEVLASGEALSPADIETFAQGRVSAWTALSQVVMSAVTGEDLRRVSIAAKASALADLKERGVDVAGYAASSAGRFAPLPRRLRPFSVLGALGHRALARDREVLDGFPALALALRHGLLGR